MLFRPNVKKNSCSEFLVEAIETEYQEVRDSCLDKDESLDENSWSDEIDETSINDPTSTCIDAIQYYMQPVNEYVNSDWKVYENYLQSDGYEEAVYSSNRQSTFSNCSQAGYEVPVKTETTITYDSISRSPVEFTLSVAP